jgi:hypothetical protein
MYPYQGNAQTFYSKQTQKLSNDDTSNVRQCRFLMIRFEDIDQQKIFKVCKYFVDIKNM